MIIKVNQDLCAGCGVCVDACSVDGIRLVDCRAVIDDALCTRCGACIKACPNGAIITMPELTQVFPPVALPAIETGSMSVQRSAALPESSTWRDNLASLAGTVLAFLGREALPYFLDNLASALEQRFASQPAKLSINPYQPARYLAHARSNRSGQMQRRRRSRIGRKK